MKGCQCRSAQCTGLLECSVITGNMDYCLRGLTAPISRIRNRSCFNTAQLGRFMACSPSHSAAASTNGKPVHPNTAGNKNTMPNFNTRIQTPAPAFVQVCWRMAATGTAAHVDQAL